MLIICIQVNSQDFRMPGSYTSKGRHGFYLSYAPGLFLTETKLDGKDYGHIKISGSGLGMDMKIGGALSNNLILHATIIGHGINGPKIRNDNDGIHNWKSDNSVSFTEMMIGAGITYYNAYDYLFSASAGLGNFTLESEKKDIDITTDDGFSYQLKVGKEWLISSRIALGVAFFFHHSNCLNQKGNDYEERLKSKNLGIVLNATYNSRR